jgi:hypothetical protein
MSDHAQELDVQNIIDISMRQFYILIDFVPTNEHECILAELNTVTADLYLKAMSDGGEFDDEFGMRMQACFTANNVPFKSTRARSLTVKWNDFRDMLNKYFDHLSLDRVDHEKLIAVSNTVWTPTGDILQQITKTGMHRLVDKNNNISTPWANYTTTTYLNGYVGCTDHYNTGNIGVLSADEFLKLTSITPTDTSKPVVHVVSEEKLITALQKSIENCNYDKLAKLAEQLLGCTCEINEEDEFELTPGSNWIGLN